MTPVRKQIANILRRVDDPELGINIVDLGLVYDLRFDEGRVDIDLTMTTPACPLSDHIVRQVETLMDRVGGIETVDVDIVWEPAWSPAMMHPSVRGQHHQPSAGPFRASG
jgi:metal-sulfur cluster biosynthetic enzyme